MWDLMNKTNKQNRNRLIDTETVLKGDRGWGVSEIAQGIKPKKTSWTQTTVL